ncbi:MAG: hypothetical protein LW878_04500, partial [Proteobacteria bacterium]|nr:hypothetical protein [Pseudomonadota bacterium]
MKKIILATLLTLTAACGEKRTLATPINDLTPAPSAEALRQLVIEDCQQRFSKLERELAPVELVPTAPVCVDDAISLKLQGIKAFLLEKNIERLYLTSTPETKLGFDIESVRSLRISVGFTQTAQELAVIWEQQFGDLKREINRTASARISDLRIEGIVVSKLDDLRRITRVVESLNKSDEFVQVINLMRAEKGE